MTPGQRRTLWACTFAMTCIFWYEASGVKWLGLWEEAAPALTGRAAVEHFWKQAGFGAVFLLLGAVLTVVLRRRCARDEFALGDCIALVVALGALAGTLFRSYRSIAGA